MRTTILYILITIITHSVLINGAQAQDRVESTLNKLDEVISNKQVYHSKLEKAIDKIKSEIKLTTDLHRKDALYQELYNHYLHFQADSALHYVNVRSRIKPSIDNKQQLNQLAINRAEVLGVMGMYSETLQALKTISVNQLDPTTRGYYYRTYRAYYGWIADYTAVNSAKEQYLELADKYRDSVLMFEPIEENRSMIEVEKLMTDNKLDKAIDILNTLADLSSDKKQQAYSHYNLALIYQEKNDIESAIFYLAETAIVDLKMGTREYASLQHLAYLLYQQGDVNRAYEYLSCSMEDAVASNAGLRFMEVTKYYPIIDQAYRTKDAMQHKATCKLLLSVSIFAIILIIFIIYLFISRKRISTMRTDLHVTNESLVTLNNRLQETGRIKEVYIARYLERCVIYIDKLDVYRRSLKRLASASKTEELLKVLQSEQMLQRERKEFFMEFDHSFLTLFPNFVNDFNLLLNDNEQIKLKSEGQLNTELRIFALIRLGITDAAQIAHFLGYSLATVYSYRSKMRNRASINKEIFEQRVMLL